MKELIDKFLSSSYEDRLKIIDEILSNEMIEETLSSLDDDTFVSLIVAIPIEKFEQFLNKFRGIIEKKLENLSDKAYAKLVEELPSEVRKAFNKRFFHSLQSFARRKSISEMVRIIYHVIPALRSTLLSPWRPVIFSKDFSERILSASIGELESFLSVLPNDIRRQFLRKHKELFLSEKIKKKLEEAPIEELVNLLRWFPEDFYREFVSAHHDVFKARGIDVFKEVSSEHGE